MVSVNDPMAELLTCKKLPERPS